MLNPLQQRLTIMAILAVKKEKTIGFYEYHNLKQTFTKDNTDVEIIQYIETQCSNGIMKIQDEIGDETSYINIGISYMWVENETPRFDLLYTNKNNKEFVTDLFLEAEFLQNIDAMGE